MIESRSKRKELRLHYAGVIDKCQDLAMIFCSSQLTELFEHAGTALLDFAERSEDNKMQGKFFEAMGLMQRRRTDIEHIFRREINRGFKNFAHLGAAARGIDSDVRTAEEPRLSLIGQDETEQHIAVERIVIKANERFFPELFALSRRLAVVVGRSKLKDYEIPASPYHFVLAFRRSMEGVRVEAKTKIVLFALFDRFVVRQAKGLYDELNGHLKEKGVLPDLRPVHVRSKDLRDRPTAKTQRLTGQKNSLTRTSPLQDAMGRTSLGQVLFDSIVDLMSKRHKTAPGGSRQKMPIGQVAASQESRNLVLAVGKMQSRRTLESVDATTTDAAGPPDPEVDHVLVNSVKETLSRERDRVLSQVHSDKLPPIDLDLIDLIGMLFQYMLDDPLLPNLAKALLSHLHTPYLKVALIDRRLLADAHHPARRLLDQIVEAGSLWVEESNPQHGIFPALQGIVDRVITEFSNDVSLFEELLTSFGQSMKEQQRKTATIEQRTQDRALGREKLRLAKRRASDQIHALLRLGPLPLPVASFLGKAWLDRLVFILLRSPDEDRSDAWKDAVKTAEDLIALLPPSSGAALPSADAERIADVRARITEGIRTLGSYPRATLDALLRFLDTPETWREACLEAAAVPADASTEKGTPKPGSAREDNLAGELATSGQEKEIIEQLSQMKLGTWFEVRSTAGAAPRRIKLSWLSRLTSTCLFVDSSGMQAEIKTLQELAREVLSGQAKAIPPPMHPFIERALVSIRSMLQGEEREMPAKEPPDRR
jgi:hypothetical protein